MAVSFVGGSYGTAVGGDLTLPDVEDVQDRDILLIAAATYWNGSGDLNWPSGFARVDPTADGYTHLAWKRASSESGNYVLPAHNQDVRVAVLMVLRGCVAIGSPFDGISNTVYSTSNTIIRAAGFTTTETTALAWFGKTYNNNIATGPSGFTLGASGANGEQMYGYYKLAQSAGATGNIDGTLSSSATSKHVIMVALTPAEDSGLAPTLTSISPERGYTTGGTSVTLTGEGFTGATGVTFGGTAATNVTVVNDTTITCTTPAKTSGSSKVVVKHGDGDSTDNVFFEFYQRIAPPLFTATKVGNIVVFDWDREESQEPEPDPFDPTDGDWYWATTTNYGGPGGLVGNGSTNNRTAMQSLMNAAATAGKGIYFPEGTYLMGKPTSGFTYLSLRSGLSMRGEGSGTTILFNDDGSDLDGFSSYGESEVEFIDLALKGTLTDNDTTLTLVRGEPLSNVSFIRCTFDMCQNAIRLIGNDPTKLSDGVLIKDCTSLTGCLQLLVGGYMTNIEIDGGNYEVNRLNYKPGAWPHHLYLGNYVTNVHVHDATFTGGAHATMDLEDGLSGTVGNFLFENIQMSGIYQGWFIAGVYNVVIDGLIWTHDSRMHDYAFWLIDDTVDFQLKNSTIIGHSTRSVPLFEIDSTCKSNTNKIGPNVIMTNCSPYYSSNHGCRVGSGGTKPTIMPPVTVLDHPGDVDHPIPPMHLHNLLMMGD